MNRVRLFPFVVVVAVTVAAWAWIVPMGRDMYGSMTGLSAWMMTSTWDAPHVALLWLMWAVMMAAMMLPSAMPLLMLYDGAVRRRSGPRHAVLAMAAGYLLVWAAFSAGATFMQRVLASAQVLTPMMEMSSRSALAITLLVAGAYQITPWKGACLRECRSPLSFVMQRWRRGTAGALRMGVEHGAYCVGCCWALMLLLFAGGVMNLTVIVGLTVVVLVEKLAPMGVAASRAIGLALLGAGAWSLVA